MALSARASTLDSKRQFKTKRSVTRHVKSGVNEELTGISVLSMFSITRFANLRISHGRSNPGWPQTYFFSLTFFLAPVFSPPLVLISAK